MTAFSPRTTIAEIVAADPAVASLDSKQSVLAESRKEG